MMSADSSKLPHSTQKSASADKSPKQKQEKRLRGKKWSRENFDRQNRELDTLKDISTSERSSKRQRRESPSPDDIVATYVDQSDVDETKQFYWKEIKEDLKQDHSIKNDHATRGVQLTRYITPELMTIGTGALHCTADNSEAVEGRVLEVQCAALAFVDSIKAEMAGDADLSDDAMREYTKSLAKAVYSLVVRANLKGADHIESQNIRKELTAKILCSSLMYLRGDLVPSGSKLALGPIDQDEVSGVLADMLPHLFAQGSGEDTALSNNSWAMDDAVTQTVSHTLTSFVTFSEDDAAQLDPNFFTDSNKALLPNLARLLLADDGRQFWLVTDDDADVPDDGPVDLEKSAAAAQKDIQAELEAEMEALQLAKQKLSKISGKVTKLPPPTFNGEQQVAQDDNAGLADDEEVAPPLPETEERASKRRRRTDRDDDRAGEVPRLKPRGRRGRVRRARADQESRTKEAPNLPGPTFNDVYSAEQDHAPPLPSIADASAVPDDDNDIAGEVPRLKPRGRRGRVRRARADQDARTKEAPSLPNPSFNDVDSAEQDHAPPLPRAADASGVPDDDNDIAGEVPRLKPRGRRGRVRRARADQDARTKEAPSLPGPIFNDVDNAEQDHAPPLPRTADASGVHDDDNDSADELAPVNGDVREIPIHKQRRRRRGKAKPDQSVEATRYTIQSRKKSDRRKAKRGLAKRLTVIEKREGKRKELLKKLRAANAAKRREAKALAAVSEAELDGVDQEAQLVRRPNLGRKAKKKEKVTATAHENKPASKLGTGRKAPGGKAKKKPLTEKARKKLEKKKQKRREKARKKAEKAYWGKNHSVDGENLKIQDL